MTTRNVSGARTYDLAIVGGGINGTAIARDAAGRGLRVVLIEMGDLAAATSSASTKLIHGGLRYLEHREFRLVREGLTEREVLLRSAPHIIRPLRFVLPHHAGLRPWWMIRAGLFLYDHLGGRRILPPTRVLDLRRDPAGAPLRPEFTAGFEYSDCWVDDARLVILNARDAARHGADIRTRTRCRHARPDGDAWRLALDPPAEVGAHEVGAREVRARALVNATGPWVSDFLANAAGHVQPTRIRMVKGSHLVVRRLFQHERCYIFQNRDGRICFAIPYEHDFTLIGTTDQDYRGDPAQAAISGAEQAYLLAALGAYLRTPIDPADIVWSYAGIRPLRDDGATPAQDATRDYVLELEPNPPLLSVFGGKITTSRRLAEAALAKLAPVFPGLGPPWTAGAPLPGGDFPWDGADALCQDLQRRYRFLTPAWAMRLIRCYGTEATQVLGDARTVGDLGRPIAAELTEREVAWLIGNEWACTAEDILWRRTKLGLRLDASAQSALATWLDSRCSSESSLLACIWFSGFAL